ncbi:MAG: phosphate ABC transporter substrate-binding protein, PhoT family [Chitinophagaceae bacterium]|nr:MAG: phosphate ABC transporter substrate-binding protein, PhoT family [Chitinophagaceae bacterium]
MKKWVRLFVSLIMAGWLVSCNNKADVPANDRFDSGVLHLSCDESFKPVMDAEIQVFQNQYPKAKVIAHYKPEADCIDDFLVDSVRLVIATRGMNGNESRLIEDSLKLGAKSTTVAYDAIAVIVHPQATDSFFTLTEIRDLIGGKSKKKLIPVFDGLKATSTVRFMLDSVLRGQPLGKNVVAAKSSLDVIDYVSRTPNAVGFVGISWVGNWDDSTQLSLMKRVRMARLESTDSAGAYVLPVQYTIYTRAYPLVRDLVYVLKEKHTGVAHGFAAFLRSDRGQLLFKRSYLFPAVRTFYIRDAELNKD